MLCHASEGIEQTKIVFMQNIHPAWTHKITIPNNALYQILWPLLLSFENLKKKKMEISISSPNPCWLFVCRYSMCVLVHICISTNKEQLTANKFTYSVPFIYPFNCYRASKVPKGEKVYLKCTQDNKFIAFEEAKLRNERKIFISSLLFTSDSHSNAWRKKVLIFSFSVPHSRMFVVICLSLIPCRNDNE